VLALLAVLLVTGCGGRGTAEPEQPAGPGDVALSYVRATFSADPSRARRWVEPASQDAYRIVELGIGDQELSARDLAVGSTKIDGDRATVIVLGTLCRKEPKAKTTEPECVTNTDPESANPIFRVFLARQADASWMVSLRIEQSIMPSPGDAPSAATSSAPAR
jgi:hypothetical protein